MNVSTTANPTLASPPIDRAERPGASEGAHEHDPLKRATSRSPHMNVIYIEKGAWAGPSACDGLAYAVIEGFLLRTTALYDRTGGELIGPGDVLSGHDIPPAGGLVERRVDWSALTGVTIRTIDLRLATPSVLRALFAAAQRRACRLTEMPGINSIPRVEQRAIALLEQVAEVWGKVTPGGIVLEIPLTHSAIAQMLGAQRPSVTTAIGRLGRALVRTDTGGWLLRQAPSTSVGQPTPSAHDGSRRARELAQAAQHDAGRIGHACE